MSAHCQHWATNFPYPHEWLWSGTWWDDFDKSRCILLEAKAKAKANYAFMFTPIINTPKIWLISSVNNVLTLKAYSHANKATPAPPVSVEWHFLQEVVYEYCSSKYEKSGYTNLSAYWNPMPGTPEKQKYDEIREEERREMEEYYRNNPGLFV
ncbi:Tox-REase-5 domain-containing protein [Metapseudomonas otitidis]|uniref:Tox-REase-5 domain-containing protein n=1 Tax=Metapseudomonas otitidis TaxID=319939 RepID=UPI003EE0F30C